MHSSNSNTPADTPPPAARKKGMTLMLTLMVLVVLATIIVQFQVDAALYERTTSYRLEKEQCRYAAESGLIIATHFINETLRKYKGRFPPNLTLSSGSSIWSTIPSDPNQLLTQDSSPQGTDSGPDLPSFVLMRDNIQIGQTDVEIEIHDENAKWPVLWHMPRNSPYFPETKMDQIQVSKGYNLFTNLSKVNRDDARTALNMIYSMNNHLRFPAAEFTINLTNLNSKKRPSRRIIYRPLSYTKKREEATERRNLMKIFGRDFKDRLINDIHVATLNQKLPGKSASFSDYLGIWGHNRININTATPELLNGAFLPLGLNDKKTRWLIEHRKKKPFIHTGDLDQMKKLGSDLVARMRPLCVVGPDTFTTKITARIGRTQYRLYGSFYQDQGRLINMAVVTE